MKTITEFNLNREVIIYPTEEGWKRIKELIAFTYSCNDLEADGWVSRRKTDNGGYKDQLWVIIHDLHDMFYNGQRWLKTNIDIINEDYIK